MKLLYDADVERHVSMEATLDALARVYESVREGRAGTAPRLTRDLPGGWIRLMTAHDEASGHMVSKIFNLARGTGVRYLLLVHRLEDGALVGLVDGRRITDLRTGGMSGLVLRELDPQRAPVEVGIIGSGHQARMQLDAIREVRDVTRVRVFSPTADNRERFAAVNATPDSPVIAVDSGAAACDGADVVVLATSSTAGTPVIEHDWLTDRAIVLGVGSTKPEQVEIPAETLSAAQWVVVDTLHACEEAGDLRLAVEAGDLTVDEVHTLETAPTPSAAQWTGGPFVFKSVGSGVQDLALAVECLDRASRLGGGVDVDEVTSLKEPMAGSPKP